MVIARPFGGGDEGNEALQVSIGCRPLDPSRDRTAEPSQQFCGPGERSDPERGPPVRTLDDERFFASFGMAGKGAVREAVPVGLVDNGDDPAHRHCRERPHRRSNGHRRPLGRPITWFDREAGGEMWRPLAQPLGASVERVVSIGQHDLMALVPEARRQQSTQRRADVVVRRTQRLCIPRDGVEI